MRAAPLLLASLLASAVAEATTEHRYALVIGANQGLHTEGELLYAERDADRMADVLGRLGGVREEDVVLLRGADSGRVLEVLAGLKARIGPPVLDEDHVLFVYYSGHADSSGLHMSGSKLSFEQLTDALSELPVNVRVLVVDACRSGGLTRVKGAAPAEPFHIEADERLLTAGTAIITSSAEGEDAQESDRVRGGLFTHHLLAGLSGAADGNGDLAVSLNEVYDYASEQTVRDTSLEEIVQHPTYAFDLRGKGDLVLTRIDEGEHVGTLALADGGEYLLFDAGGRGALVTEFRVDDDSLVSVAPGRYLLRRRDLHSVSELDLVVRPGRTEPVGVDDMETQPYGATIRRGRAVSSGPVSGFVLGVGVEGPLLDALSPGPTGFLGARLDFEPLSLLGRVRYGWQGAVNGDLQLSSHRVGADLALMKLFDIGRSAPGLGVRAGADGVFQRFVSSGEAPARNALVGRAGGFLRYEHAPAARVVFGLEGGVDLSFLQESTAESSTPSLTTRVVPYASFDLSFYGSHRARTAARVR